MSIRKKNKLALVHVVDFYCAKYSLSKVDILLFKINLVSDTVYTDRRSTSSTKQYKSYLAIQQ